MDIWNANELIDNDAIDNLSDSQVDELLDILKDIQTNSPSWEDPLALWLEGFLYPKAIITI